jgi:hypothetical protein
MADPGGNAVFQSSTSSESDVLFCVKHRQHLEHGLAVLHAWHDSLSLRLGGGSDAGNNDDANEERGRFLHLLNSMIVVVSVQGNARGACLVQNRHWIDEALGVSEVQKQTTMTIPEYVAHYYAVIAALLHESANPKQRAALALLRAFDLYCLAKHEVRESVCMCASMRVIDRL